MLIRDFLSERTGDYPVAQQLFAECINNLLQVVATGISLFDHSTCYTLLDFLEEALVLLARFDRSTGREEMLLNLDFWTSVWQKMLSSQNTTTEIRLYSFLYTVWNTVICGRGWKEKICMDLLLDRDIFESRFNHWCPIVRAYYMRLICWRVARHDGDYASVDVEVLETLLDRLRGTWSHYLFLRGLSELRKAPFPSTSPCYPVPSRRLVIVRTDGTGESGYRSPFVRRHFSDERLHRLRLFSAETRLDILAYRHRFEARLIHVRLRIRF